MTGLTPEEVVADPAALYGRVLPEDAPNLAALEAAALETGTPFDCQFRIRDRAGGVRWLHCRSAPRSADGVTVWDGLALDVTARHAAEGEVARLNAELAGRLGELQTIFDTAPVGINVARDPACKVITGNKALAELLGLPDGENVSKSRDDADRVPYEVFRGGRRLDPGELPMQRAAGSGEVVVGEMLEVVRGDGRRVALLMNASPVRDPTGAVYGAVGVCTDVTGLREEQRRKDEFLATLAHELRNPLAPVRTGVRLLARAPAGETAARTLAMMERQLAHTARLVEDLVDLDRVTRGLVGLRPEPLDLGGVVRAAAEAARPLLEASGHRLDVSPPGGPVAVSGDRTRLAQVLANLLDNAAQYTPPGGRVTLAAGREGGDAVVRVTDTGVGMPADLVPRVFEVFTRGGAPADRARGGLGIGLALVRRLVETHGGTVAAESPGPGRGSTFTVRLPLLRGEGTGAGGEQDMPPDPSPLEPVPSRRVLVVDDNADGADSLAEFLRVLGYETRTAYDGPDAVTAARAFRPAAVLLDIGLPGFSGYDVARRLRADPATADALIVAVTGWGAEEDRRRSREAGIDEHFVKPVDPVEVVAALARHTHSS